MTAIPGEMDARTLETSTALAAIELAEHPLRIEGVILQVSVSMGLAAYPEHGRTLSEVTERADQALYVSKREGRSRDHVWAA